MGRKALLICIVANVFGIIAVLLQKAVSYETAVSTGLILFTIVYGIFAATLAPILFVFAIFTAPKGTFTRNTLADEAVVTYRRLFWGNLLLAVFRWWDIIYVLLRIALVPSNR